MRDVSVFKDVVGLMNAKRGRGMTLEMAVLVLRMDRALMAQPYEE